MGGKAQHSCRVTFGRGRDSSSSSRYSCLSFLYKSAEGESPPASLSTLIHDAGEWTRGDGGGTWDDPEADVGKGSADGGGGNKL